MEESGKKKIGRPPKALKEQQQQQPTAIAQPIEQQKQEKPALAEVEDNMPIEAAKAPKAKRGQSDTTKAALAAGRARLAEINEAKRKEKAELAEKYALKKAEKVIEEKRKLKQSYGLAESDSDDESVDEVVTKKELKKILEESKAIKVKEKPKKKVVYVESESEEEPVYVTRRKAVPKTPVHVQASPSIMFF